MANANAAHRRTISLNKTKVIINVYDLMPPGKLSWCLWQVGASMLHSGVVVGDKEYAFGGHDRKGVSGVYWTQPQIQQPGCTWRAEILHGITVLSPSEIDEIIAEASHKFLGQEWNLLTNNCNTFTTYLCEALTGQPAPAWLNRAATIGLSLPRCVLPTEYLTAPDADTADGELLEADDTDERAAMLRVARNPAGASTSTLGNDGDDTTDDDYDQRSIDEHKNGRSLLEPQARGRPVSRKESTGKSLPVSQRAPA